MMMIIIVMKVIMIMREWVQRVIHQLVIITPRGKKKLDNGQTLNPFLLQAQLLVLNHP